MRVNVHVFKHKCPKANVTRFGMGKRPRTKHGQFIVKSFVFNRIPEYVKKVSLSNLQSTNPHPRKKSILDVLYRVILSP